MASKRKTKAEKLASTPLEEIGKLKGEAGEATLRSYIKTFRYAYKRRSSAFRRAGLRSVALAIFQDSKAAEMRPLGKLNRNQLISEFASYADFFSAEGGSTEGARKINLEQDRRIFGTDSRNRPLRRMSQDERDRFWKIYNEFLHQKKLAEEKYGSGQIQQILASEKFRDDFDTDDLQGLFDELEETLESVKEGEELEEELNIQRGRGDNI